MSQISDKSNIKRVKLLYGVNGSLMILGNICAAFTYAWLGSRWMNSTAMYVWIAYMLAAFSYRHFIGVAFRKVSDSDSFDFKRWEKLYALGLALTAAGWGLAAWLPAADANDEIRYVLAFIVVGLVAGGATNYSVSKLTTYTVMLPMVIPFSIRMILHHQHVSVSLGVLIFVLMVLLMSASFRRRDFTLQAWAVADEREILSRELVETQAKATQAAKMAALGQMAAGIAHEINTPLAIISASAQTMLELDGDPDTIKLLAQQIDETALRIAKIVSGLRSFSRQDQRDPSREFEIGEVIENTLALCCERFKGAGIKLNVQPLVQSYRVSGHSTQLSQVLLNLLNNAADATEGLPQRWVKIETKVNDANHLCISVIDSGSGIPAELHAKLMEPFFTTKEVGKGTGLGLSVAHGIMVAHQGSLTIDSNNTNTCFVMQLPLAS